MTAFELALDKKLKERWSEVKKSDNSKLLEGITLEELRNRLFKIVREHINKLDVNVHKLDSDQLDTFSKTVIETMFEDYLSLDSGMPLSFYGDRTYLPAPIDGSFESTTNYIESNWNPCFIEDGGTLVIIRNGTDGSALGPYYSHCRNFDNPNTEINVLNTNQRYSPKFLPEHQKTHLILSGNDHTLVGTVKNERNGVISLFVALTNGTFDDNYHEGVIIPIDDLPLKSAHYTNRIYPPNAIVVGNLVYLILPNGPVSFYVWSMRLNDVRDGKYAKTVRNVKINWHGSWITREFFQISPVDMSLGGLHKTTGKAVTYGVGGWGGFRIHPVYLNGKCKIVMNQHVQWGAVDNIAPWLQSGCTIVAEFDLNDSLEFDVRKYVNEPFTIDYTDALITVADGLGRGLLKYNVSENHIFDDGTAGHFTYNWSIRDKVSARVSHSAPPGRFYITRLLHSEDVTPTKIFNNDPIVIRREMPFILPNKPNDLFIKVNSLGWLSSTSMIFRNDVRGSDQFIPTYAKIPNDSLTHPYESIFGNKMTGFPETNEKVLVHKLNSSIMSEGTKVNLVHENVGTAMTVHGDFYGNKSINDNDYIYPNSVSASGKISSLMEKKVTGEKIEEVRKTLINHLKATIGVKRDEDLSLDLVIPRTGKTPFICGIFVSDIVDLYRGYMYFCDVTISGGNIIPILSSLTYMTDGHISVRYIGDAGYGGISHIRKVDNKNEYLISHTASMNMIVSGNTNKRTSVVHYNPASRKYTFLVSPYGSDEGTGPSCVALHPKYGFMSVASSTTQVAFGTDSGTKTTTKILFRDNFQLGVLYSPYADIRNSGYVLISQKSPSRWSIFFSEDVPVMIDGYVGYVEKYVHELNPSADKDSVFYIWVILTNGKFSYRITKDVNHVPNEPNIFVGKVTTDTTGIKNIDVDKHVAVDGHYLSTEPMGNAIPLSVGQVSIKKELEWAD